MKTILVDAVGTLVIEIANDFKIFTPLQKMLDDFPNQKIILTNANGEQLLKFGLDKAPYKVFTLKHNPNKTNPEYYRQMLNHFGLKPEEAIYFEHSPEAVASAQSVSIKTYHWDSKKQPLIELANFLKDNL